MDLIRASIKALFYDYSPDLVGNHILHSDKEADILKCFAEMAAWREQDFTLSEMNELLKVLKTRWLNQPGYSKSPIMSKLLLLPFEFTRQIMLLDEGVQYPVIRFEDLLRWRELSYYVGEDMLTCSYLAMVDKNERIHFVWNTYLSHDNDNVNEIINSGLTDIHHHLWGSIDVSELNWIRLMNNPEEWNIDKGLSIDESATSKDLILVSKEERCSLFHWIVVAAATRLILFEWLQTPEKDVLMDNIDRLIPKDSTRIFRWLNGEFKNELDDLRGKLLVTAKEHCPWDYAIMDGFTISDEDKKSPYMLHYGERRFMYSMFRMFYMSRNDDNGVKVCNLAKYFYLYLIIKTHIRKQMVQTNPLKGLRNFMDYMIDQKRCFLSDIGDSRYDSVLYRYVIQTAVGTNGQYGLENRINTYEGKNLLVEDFSIPIFCEGRCISNTNKITTVASLSKNLFSKNSSVDETKGKLSEIAVQYMHNDKYQTNVVGVDFSGMEIDVRPEKIAPFIRWLRLKGVSHFTYHIGEDYLDLIDGLRSIDELVRFAEYEDGDRLGHAIALGVNPHNYYESRHYNVILSKPGIIDNIVWLIKTVENVDEDDRLIMEKLGRIAETLFGECGFIGKFDLNTYWNSMLLRGDYPGITTGLSDWAKACCSKEAEEARKDELAIKWCDFNKKLDKSSISFQWPKDIVRLVEKCQLQLRSRMSKYHIEVCPSSNIHIGGFKRYDRHPILTIQKDNEDAPIFSLSINTDDRGIFSTSLPFEYSLIALSLFKDGKNNENVMAFLNQCKKEAEKNRFNNIIT